MSRRFEPGEAGCRDRQDRVVYCPHCARLDVAAWLRTKGMRVGPALAANLEEILDPGHVPASVEALCVPISTLRHRLRKKGLPAPTAWVQLARLLLVIRTLGANPTQPLERIAWLCGYRDHSACSHMLRRNLGLGVKDIRARLGAESQPTQFLDLWWETASTGRLQTAHRPDHPMLRAGTMGIV